MSNYFRRSLGRQVIIINLVFVFLLLAGMVSLRLYHVNLTNSLDHAISAKQEKLNFVSNMKENLNSIMFDSRGYFAFGSEAFIEQIGKKEEQIKADLVTFEKKYNSDKDEEILAEVRLFTDSYFNELLPKAIEFRRNGQIDEIVKMSQQDGGTQKVNNVLSSLENYKVDIQEDIDETYSKKDQKTSVSQLIYFSFLIFMVLAFLGLIRMMVKRFGSPLREIANVSSQITKGDHIDKIPYTDRLDEIGVLSQAFEKMIRGIQNNEQELIAQNEELAAQQDELNEQQEKLREALSTTEQNEKMLLRMNSFIHSISNTLDKHQLLKSIVNNMVEITYSSKGLIWLIDGSETATVGLSDSERIQFLEHFPESGMLVRLKESTLSYQVMRDTSRSEKGYIESPFKSGDLYIPIFSGKREILAVIVLTRIGSSYSCDEVTEYQGLARQVALSLEKLKLYEDSEKQRVTMKNVMNSIHEGIQLIDNDGNIISSNQKFCEFMNCDNPEQLTSMGFEEWTNRLKGRVHGAHKLLSFIENAVHEKNDIGISYVFELEGEVKRVIQIYSESLIQNDTKLGTVIVYRDITKEYEVDQMKSEFVTTVSHELRTPLSSVLGFTELMLTRELKPERQKKYLTTIHQEAFRLTSLINDFLDVQKMESGNQEFDKKYHSILPIIEDVIDVQKVNSEKHVFDIDVQTEKLSVFGDRDKLSQVFMNLISNAVKYSPEGGKVLVTLRNNENHLIIDIKDEGLGIPKSAIGNLFTKFYRVDNSDRRKIGGTGLGLAIVKEIVKVHQGHISVESNLGEGSTFTVVFPVIDDVYVNASLTQTKGQKVDIIIIEDDRHLAGLITEELMEHGFHIAQFNNGEDAVKMVEETKPEAIVLDILLEGKMDGWQVIQSLKSNPVTKDIPIFISSALDEKQRGLNLGAAGYLIKPYQPSQLTSSILQVMLNKEKNGHILIPEEPSQTKD
ncbi:ATP-binding protein [Fictibacillus sp. b24]|uniref:ATP-binding protein n=1 Tax=Fictibacillus sp. b24 TaxID=3055863 RepID=UPI0025A10844|nr:ATP-binding protein [Fictibacillus sp. b24]MDM5317411.1 ATP-binding protein [Fictibacillus sp. b24]